MSCANKVIVFSGFRDDSLKAQIEAAGGKVASSLVKAATDLVVKRDGKASKKVDEARDKGLNINYLDDFVKEFGFKLDEAPKEPKEPKATKPPHKAAEEPKAAGTDMELLCKVMNALNTKTKDDAALAAIAEIAKRISSF